MPAGGSLTFRQGRIRKRCPGAEIQERSSTISIQPPPVNRLKTPHYTTTAGLLFGGWNYRNRRRKRNPSRTKSAKLSKELGSDRREAERIVRIRFTFFAKVFRVYRLASHLMQTLKTTSTAHKSTQTLLVVTSIKLEDKTSDGLSQQETFSRAVTLPG